MHALARGQPSPPSRSKYCIAPQSAQPGHQGNVGVQTQQTQFTPAPQHGESCCCRRCRGDVGAGDGPAPRQGRRSERGLHDAAALRKRAWKQSENGGRRRCRGDVAGDGPARKGRGRSERGLQHAAALTHNEAHALRQHLLQRGSLRSQDLLTRTRTLRVTPPFKLSWLILTSAAWCQRQ